MTDTPQTPTLQTPTLQTLSVRLTENRIEAEIAGGAPGRSFAFQLCQGEEVVATRDFSAETAAGFDRPAGPNLTVHAMVREPPVKPQRSIRLKEWGVRLDTHRGPSADYLTRTDGLEPGQFRIQTDENGFCVSGEAPADDGETWVFLGDSFVEAAYVAEAARFPAVVERQLRTAGQRVTCLNAGYSGATTLHLFNVLMNKVLPLKPERVLFFAPTNDTRAFAHPGGYWCNNELFAPVMPPDDTRPPVAKVEQPQALIIELFVSACRMAGIELVMGTSPHRQQDEAADPWLAKRYSRRGFQATIDARRACNAVARAAAAKHGLRLVDLEMLNAEYAPISYDDVHLNEGGGVVVARQIIAALEG